MQAQLPKLRRGAAGLAGEGGLGMAEGWTWHTAAGRHRERGTCGTSVASVQRAQAPQSISHLHSFLQPSLQNRLIDP